MSDYVRITFSEKPASEVRIDIYNSDEMIADNRPNGNAQNNTFSTTNDSQDFLDSRGRDLLTVSKYVKCGLQKCENVQQMNISSSQRFCVFEIEAFAIWDAAPRWNPWGDWGECAPTNCKYMQHSNR